MCYYPVIKDGQQALFKQQTFVTYSSECGSKYCSGLIKSCNGLEASREIDFLFFFKNNPYS